MFNRVRASVYDVSKLLKPIAINEINKSLNEEFLKKHEGKPMLSLLPWREIEQVSKVFDYGEKKYTRDNWKKGKPEDYLSASLRHVSARAQGNLTDESTYPHLAHAVCSLLFVMWMDNQAEKQKGKVSFGIDWGAPEGVWDDENTKKPPTNHVPENTK